MANALNLATPLPHDLSWMRQALRLAEQGLYTTTPNPRVGCVIVNDQQQCVGTGFHARAGAPHAEVFALREAGAQAQGATAYVTLEPCSHYGRTPPCADALIAAGVKRVVVAMTDPNPLVSGRGLAKLQAAGMAVTQDVLRPEAEALNRGFIKRMQTGMPFVRLKIASSLDGKTALLNGQSQWITGEAARQDVHHWRAQACAVLTGSGTILADQPQLTVRHVPTSRQPKRIVLDRRGRLDPRAYPDFIIEQSQDDLKTILMRLAKTYQLNEIFVEAGSVLNAAFLEANLIDELIVYVAPRLLGHEARGLFALPCQEILANCPTCHFFESKMIGHDVRLRATFTASSS